MERCKKRANPRGNDRGRANPPPDRIVISVDAVVRRPVGSDMSDPGPRLVLFAGRNS